MSSAQPYDRCQIGNPKRRSEMSFDMGLDAFDLPRGQAAPHRHVLSADTISEECRCAHYAGQRCVAIGTNHLIGVLEKLDDNRSESFALRHIEPSDLTTLDQHP